MKILFYNHTGQVSGAERMLLMILSRLERDRFQPMVVCPEDGPLQGMVVETGAPVESISTLQARFTLRPDRFLDYLRSFYRVLHQFRRTVVTTKPDLIHANSIRAGLVATAATLGLKTNVIWHLHDMLPPHPLSAGIRAFAALSPRTRMIAVSDAVAENFTFSFSRLRRRVSVILNGIELEKFQLNNSARREVCDEFSLDQAGPLVGIVGQVTPRKGQLELVQAFAEVLKEIPGATLLIAGAPLFNRDGDYARLVEQTALKLGIAERVKFCGERSDVARIMQALDLLVVNSKVEPFGLVVVEAMACGTAVLSTKSGGPNELIEHGRNGWLIPVGDEHSLAAAIVNLVRNPEMRSLLAQEAGHSLAERFSAERYLAEVQSFYLRNTNSKFEIDEPASGRAEVATFS